MSSEQDRVRELAERVARRLADSDGGEAASSGGGDIDALRESLSEIQRRLARIESQMTDGRARESTSQSRPAAHEREGAPAQQNTPHTTPTRSMWLSGTYVPATSHPSQEQFTGIGEAVSELVEFFEREKTCTVEPGGKPCDHCGMCSSRGF